jgi:nucleotide-binding universal stress UspA family protein
VQGKASDGNTNYRPGRRTRELREAGFSVSVAVLFGEPVEEIVRFVENEGVDLVAMATHSHGGPPRFPLGSVAAGVLQQLQVPALFLRPFSRAASGATTI